MIRGERVTLRPATADDRRAIYEWLACSDVTSSMMGPPLFPDMPIPTWEQFRDDDYELLFFDGSRPDLGRSYIIEVDAEAIGHISYGEGDLTPGFAELDIWMRAETVCGRGYGADAVATLARHLYETLGLREFILRPSRRNVRAIAAYERAGFVRMALSNEEQAALYGPGDYDDTVVLRKRMDAH